MWPTFEELPHRYLGRIAGAVNAAVGVSSEKIGTQLEDFSDQSQQERDRRLLALAMKEKDLKAFRSDPLIALVYTMCIREGARWKSFGHIPRLQVSDVWDKEDFWVWRRTT